MPRMDFKQLERSMGIKPSWDEFFFKVLDEVSFRSISKTGRRQGAILVKNNCIISIGFFDAYLSMEEDKKKKTADSQEKIIERGSGAIENAIANCARLGISSKDSILYVYGFPNDSICKVVAQAGISEIRYIKENTESFLGRRLCEELNIKMTLLKKI